MYYEFPCVYVGVLLPGREVLKVLNGVLLSGISGNWSFYRGLG